jgi:hypothetical protein
VLADLAGGMTRWPRPKFCLADRGGKHRWRYSPDRRRRTCRKCGTEQEARA